MSSLVSVVIPAYNSESVITRCVDSLLSQSYENLEVIIVDDGSTDDTGSICEGFLSSSIVRVIHQNNQGVSAARNTGLGEARGEFVTFVDADDYVSADYVRNLVDRIDGSDLSIVGYICSCNGRERIVSFSPSIVSTDTWDELIVDFKMSQITSPWAKLYRMKIIRENDLRFQNGMQHSEDLVFLYNYILKSKTVAFSGSCDYFYCILPSGSLSQKVNSFETEYFGYSIANELVSRIIKMGKINDDQAVNRILKPLSTIIDRVVNSIYHSEKNYSKKDRIQMLKKLDCSIYSNKIEGDFKLCVQHSLLFHRLYGIFDLIRTRKRFFVKQINA